MVSNPSLEMLLGNTFEEDSSHFKFAKSEFLEINFTEKLQHNNALIAGVHEVLYRSYYGRWLDEEGNSIGDDIGVALYDYARIYDEVKIVGLGKRISDDIITYSYLWYFKDDFNPETYPTNISTSLVTINNEQVLISKEALGYPIDSLEFLKSFLSYCFQSNIEGITINDDKIIEIIIFDDTFQANLDSLSPEKSFS